MFPKCWPILQRRNLKAYPPLLTVLENQAIHHSAYFRIQDIKVKIKINDTIVKMMPTRFLVSALSMDPTE